jgi:hypothetical protein
VAALLLLVGGYLYVLEGQLKWRAPMASDLEPLIDAPVAAVRRVTHGGRRAATTGEPGGSASSHNRNRLVRQRSRREQGEALGEP